MFCDNGKLTSIIIKIKRTVIGPDVTPSQQNEIDLDTLITLFRTD